MSNTLKIYHNTRCSKSREACSIVAKNGITAEVIEYLKTPPSQSEIKHLLQLLGMKAEDIVRKGETLYKEKYKDKKFKEAEWIKILAEHPILIERPIIVKGNKAIIARPPEKVLELLK
jgi:arsenate reductase